MPVTVLMPPEHLPTPAVFGSLTADERGPRAGRGVEWWCRRLPRGDWPQILHNRLTAPAVRLCPAVGALLAHLQQQGVPCLMSGSGAACFALGACEPPAGVTVWRTSFIPRSDALAPPAMK
jgi:4-diphosphocytidyl-2C-methyl-D-erythritol kinase